MYNNSVRYVCTTLNQMMLLLELSSVSASSVQVSSSPSSGPNTMPYYLLTFSAPRTRIRPSYTHSADAFTGNARSRDGPRPRKYPLYPSEACIRRMVARKDGFALVCGVAIIRLVKRHSTPVSGPSDISRTGLYDTHFLMLSAGIPIIQNANEAKPPERKFAVGVLI